MAFADTLHRASWRGVPFGMEAASATYGRRLARHDYPYRDTVWLEDQGKLPRSFSLVGFLIGNSAVYGGGDLAGQVRRMEVAAEATGPGILVHPSRGRITVTLVSLAINERGEEGNYAELVFSFVQGGQQAFPAVLGALGDLIGKAAGLADAAGLGAFVSAVAGPLTQGLDAAASIAATASEWVDRLSGLARDATSLYGTVSQLGGADYGRYFNGRNAGFLEGLSSPYAGASSIPDLIVAGATRRADVAAAGAAVETAISSLGVTTSATDVASAVQAAVATLQGSAANPADGVRMMVDLAGFSPLANASAASAGVAVTDLFRRAAAVACARASAAYAPSSTEDAHAVRATVLRPIEAAISRAGVTGEDVVFTTLRGVRKAVVEDLAARGGALSRLTDVETPIALPAAVIAQRLYGDVERAPELVTQADPTHPWFMPTAFKALAS